MNQFFFKKGIALILIFCIPFLAKAKIRLPYFISDNMVLQQQTNASLWGWSNPSALITITTSWNKKKYSTKADAKGNWKIAVTTSIAGGPYKIAFADNELITINNVLIGEVWLCSGQSNMEMPLKGYKDQPIKSSNDAVFNADNDWIRMFTIPRSVKLHAMDTSKNSSWKIATTENAFNFSAVAYHYAKILQQKLKVPIGIMHISYGGSTAEAWMSEEALKQFPDIKIPPASDSSKVNNKSATTLYNGMLFPFFGYAFKGCLWYQGESNSDRPDQYETLFPAMVKQWRTEFNQGEFPFYFAQIAPYNYTQLGTTPKNEKANSAYLRDAQRKTALTISNSGMVVLMDNGEANNIHPADKEIVGKRFAYLSLAKTYGLKGFAYCSPTLDSLKLTDTTATVKFKDAPNGLTTFGKPLTNFEVAGANKIFQPAKAAIRGGTIVITAPAGVKPVAVRYAFKDFVVGELYSTEGYPVSSFRTDEW